MINEEKLERMLLDLGHTECMKGTEYIRMAVALYRPGMAISRELYPALAKAAGSTPSNVERAMRYAVGSAWGRGSIGAQQEYFGYSVDPRKGMPTVGEYVSRIARLCSAD